jgi:hypothetical protein
LNCKKQVSIVAGSKNFEPILSNRALLRFILPFQNQSTFQKKRWDEITNIRKTIFQTRLPRIPRFPAAQDFRAIRKFLIIRRFEKNVDKNG